LSRIFGEIRQNGYVVRDIESAMKHWTHIMGVGPFYDQRLLAEGYRVGQSGSIGGPQGRFVYFTTEAHPGTVIELSDVSGAKGAIFRRIAEAAKNWDGSDPIHRISIGS